MLLQKEVDALAIKQASREAERLSAADRHIEVGVYRMSNGRIEARTGNRHMIPGVRIAQYAYGKCVDD